MMDEEPVEKVASRSNSRTGSGLGEEDPFGQSGDPHTPPPLPPGDEPDEGAEECREAHPHRVPSSSDVRQSFSSGGAADSSILSQESSIYNKDHENPLMAHHHPHRVKASDADLEEGQGDETPPRPGEEAGEPRATTGDEDPFASADAPSGMPPLNLKRMGSSSGHRSFTRSGSMSQQPNLHEVMYENKANKKSSLESRMVASRKSLGGGEDPFASFGARRTSTESPQIVSGNGSPGVLQSSTSFTSEERRTADQDPEDLFLPNMQREQFIPVRVARDKVKHVLSEMAHMRSMHLKALETMEKQQSFLKAQLEAATAKYVKKLTTDYNNRVTALEAEYQRRLTNLNANAMGSLNHDLEAAKANIKVMEEKAMTKVKDREMELEQEQRMFLAKMEQQRHETQQFSDQVEERNARISEYEQRIAELEEQVASGGGGGPSKSATPVPVDEQVAELQTKVGHLQAAYEAEVAQREALEQQAVEMQEQIIQARRSSRNPSRVPEPEEA